MDTFAALEARLGHAFADRDLLREALTHPSYFNEHPGEGAHNQRLEFLGDSVLGLIITEALYRQHPGEPEGVLSRHRSVLTKGRCLSQLALELGLDVALLLGASEASTGGRARASNLEDVFEAVVGALHLDAGLERTREIVLSIYGPLAPRLASGGAQDNPKGRLQELIQPTHGTTPLRYETAQIGGPDHAREFASRVWLAERLLGEGRGPSKKAAEEVAMPRHAASCCD
ncbi:MAG: ribonuclease III [Opitutaceae bacterium]|nr:ribonuclease III [Opitutaceae bacterium]